MPLIHTAGKLQYKNILPDLRKLMPPRTAGIEPGLNTSKKSWIAFVVISTTQVRKNYGCRPRLP